MAFPYFCFVIVFVLLKCSWRFVLIGFSAWKLGGCPTLITHTPSAKSPGEKGFHAVWRCVGLEEILQLDEY